MAKTVPLHLTSSPSRSKLVCPPPAPAVAAAVRVAAGGAGVCGCVRGGGGELHAERDAGAGPPRLATLASGPQTIRPSPQLTGEPVSFITDLQVAAALAAVHAAHEVLEQPRPRQNHLPPRPSKLRRPHSRSDAEAQTSGYPARLIRVIRSETHCPSRLIRVI